MVNPRQKKPRTRVAKTKTFSGCWTCRQRKVKCDLQKPECLRCLKAGRNCEGYSLLLHWIGDESDGHPIRPTAIKRKAMLSPQFLAWKLDMHQVDEILARVDAEGSQFNMKTGPFSVFQVSGYYKPTKYATTSSNSLVRTGTSLSSLLSAAGPPSISDLPALSYQDQLIATLQKPIFSSTIFYNRWPLAAKLFHHYATNVTDLLRPFLHPGNFYSTVYVPRAIMGAESLFSNQESEPRGFPSWSNKSIFYSLLSTAAFHLRGIKSRDYNYQCQPMENIGRFCRMMAYRHLRTAMTGSMKNIEELQNVMSATLSLITIDIMEGGMSEYWLHLKGFKRLQILSNRLQSPTQKLCKTERHLKTVFYCQSTLSRSTDCGLPPLPWPSHLLESDVADESIDNHCLQHTYGVTHTLLRSIHNIKTPSRHLAYYLSRGLNLPNGLERERVAVGEKLLLWNIECEEIVLFDDSEAARLTAKITRLHVLAFSYAIQVFYMTHLVLPVDLGELSNDEITVKLQHQISRVASCLRKIEVIKRENPGVFRKPMAPILWPGYIASCEAGPGGRGLWLEWWEGMLKYRIGNIQPLWNAVQETWRSRDEDAFGLSGMSEGSSDSQGLSRCLPLWRGFLRGRQSMIFAL